MARFVVDPAVAVKWFVPEEHSSPAARLLDGGNEILAADTLLSDAVRLITKKVQLGELSPGEGVTLLHALRSVPVELLPSHPMLEPALRMAAALDLTLPQGLGITAAIHGDCRLVTADRTLYEKLQGTPFAAHVKWVGDIR